MLPAKFMRLFWNSCDRVGRKLFPKPKWKGRILAEPSLVFRQAWACLGKAWAGPPGVSFMRFFVGWL